MRVTLMSLMFLSIPAKQLNVPSVFSKTFLIANINLIFLKNIKEFIYVFNNHNKIQFYYYGLFYNVLLASVKFIMNAKVGFKIIYIKKYGGMLFTIILAICSNQCVFFLFHHNR